MVDIIEVYRRIEAAAKKGVGLRLSAEEVFSVSCDQAVRDAVDRADYEESEYYKARAELLNSQP